MLGPSGKLEEDIMKWHRFFAVASVVCGLLATYTGFKHK